MSLYEKAKEAHKLTTNELRDGLKEAREVEAHCQNELKAYLEVQDGLREDASDTAKNYLADRLESTTRGRDLWREIARQLQTEADSRDATEKEALEMAAVELTCAANQLRVAGRECLASQIDALRQELTYEVKQLGRTEEEATEETLRARIDELDPWTE